MKCGRKEGIETESGFRNDSREGIKMNLKGKIDPKGYKAITKYISQVEKSTSSS